MIVFCYDKTWDGLLSALFDAFSLQLFPERLMACDDIPPLLAGNIHQVVTAVDKSERVSAGLKKKLSPRSYNSLAYVWLSEAAGSDMMLFAYMRKIFSSPNFQEGDFSDANTLALGRLARKVRKEIMYVMQFVRFQKTGDDIYFSLISARYNVLPLAIPYFKNRFADQKWIIYDSGRDYGFFYDMRQMSEIRLNHDAPLKDGRLDDEALAENERLFQESWQKYYQALSIKERHNPKLHRQNVPQRFWRFLHEKD